MSTTSHDVLMDSIGVGSVNQNTTPNGNKRPAPLTHDVSLVGEHAPDIKSVVKRLQAAVEEAWPTRGQSRYTQVHVLMLSWEDDDLNVLSEIRQLESIFRASYRYDVQSWRIPDEKPATRLQFRLAEFLKHDGPETLLIVYYAGHAIQDEQRSEPPVWASRRGNPARLPSITVQSILSECDSDVLLLYDCCHAIPATTGITGCGVKEFLAACGFESIAPEVGQDSFTHALVQELGKASYGSISVGELYGRLIDSLRTWKPCISKNELGQMRFNSLGKPLYERSKQKTPIHCGLSNEQKRRSIVLSPLPDPNESPTLHSVPEPSSATQGRKKTRYKYATDDEDGNSGTSESTECSQVIISIRVDTEDFNVDTWSEWIKEVPPEATEIKVEGIYGSSSTLVLLRMPITNWVLLPDDGPYSFIGFVTTENLAPALQRSTHSDVNMQETHHKDQSIRTAKSTIGGLKKSLSTLSLTRELLESRTEMKKSSIPEVHPTNKDNESGDIQPGKVGKASQGGQAPHINHESKDAKPKQEQHRPLPADTRLSDPMLYGAHIECWTCSQCGEAGMSTFVSVCPSCDHTSCTSCDYYEVKRR